MSYNTKNYRKQGGDEWVVGGKQTIKAGGEVDFETGSAQMCIRDRRRAGSSGRG